MTVTLLESRTHYAVGMKMAEEGNAPCCSLQNSLTPPEYRKWRRVHGLQLPLHPQQVIGWFALLGFGAATFLVLIPSLGSVLRSPLMALLSGFFLIHVASHLAALLIDPADPNLRLLKVTSAIPEFDRTKHAHVIENGRCHLCNIRTSGVQTKHCSVCNKCVERFDHHCKWLNHCVGGRNYVAFVVCVVSAVAASLTMVALSVAELILYHLDPVWLSFWEHGYNNATVEDVASVFPPQDEIFLVVVGGVGTFAAITAGLLLHLCFFHVYISVLGITTYEYIRSYRQMSGGKHASNMQVPYDPESVQTKRLHRLGRCCLPQERMKPSSHDKGVKQDVTCDIEQRQHKSDTRRCCTGKPYSESSINPSIHVPKLTSPAMPEDDVEYSVNDVCGQTSLYETAIVRLEATVEDPTNELKLPEQSPPRRNECSTTLLGNLWTRLADYSSQPSQLNVRCNQVKPSPGEEAPPREQDAVKDWWRSSSPLKTNRVTLPALAPPGRRRLQSAAELRELRNSLVAVQTNPDFVATSQRKQQQHKRKANVAHRTKSPSLSPIRESGLSTSTSPQLDGDPILPEQQDTQFSDEKDSIFVVRAPRLRAGLWTTIDQPCV